MKISQWTTLIILSNVLLQCSASNSKPAEESYLASNYRELSELLQSDGSADQGNVNFVKAAAISTPCVVHIMTRMSVTRNYVSPYQDFFGNQFLYNYPKTENQEASGSGVIVDANGYIVTNLHVVQGAEEIKVVLRNKNEYKAKIVGYDKDTDIALIKIDETNLPTINYANSDKVLVGEWVLAVGNPFNLESTVTQGIVSAKGRALNMESGKSKSPIESFIQTDAAVNPGNSGGALVNLKGELIGINTAIASPTGAYAGYAFAVPSNIVNKVVSDIREFGTVQRAFLGISPAQMNTEKSKQLKLTANSGVLIQQVFQNSAAAEAGLKPDDVIVKLDNKDIVSFPELLEAISTHRPGETINVSYFRDGQLNTAKLKLKNAYNNTKTVTASKNSFESLGIQVTPLPDPYKRELGINYGVISKVTNKGIISAQTKIKNGFVILAINNKKIASQADIEEILSDPDTKELLINGIYFDNPYKYQYNVKLD